MRSNCCIASRAYRAIADARMQQSFQNPQLRVDVDRSRMSQFGLTERDVTNSLVTTLAGSSQTAPTFWLDPKSGVSYPIVAQTPEYLIPNLTSLENVPVTARAAGCRSWRPRQDHARAVGRRGLAL